MNSRRLLLDAGNTRLKWAVVEGGIWLAQGSTPYRDLSALTPILEPHASCYIASVVRTQHEAQMIALLAPYSIAPVWLTTESQFADVTNTYLHPRQLGVDRWMGLLASRQRSHAATLVVSAGTAMTVDALSAEGTFLGGLIVPGMAMMQRALQQGTAHVADVDGVWQTFPRMTADAVQSGIIAALCGAIQRQYAYLAGVAGMPPDVILTGGDAETLLPFLDLRVEYVPMLVLEGMERVTREGKSK
ncbi:MAG: type III pantothenate kinase [Hydrogenophilales bacterium 17-61-9]|nr:MAG: type III pantothenate kinase [Hydrogenophilales bacterium 17-61-9]